MPIFHYKVAKQAFGARHGLWDSILGWLLVLLISALSLFIVASCTNIPQASGVYGMVQAAFPI